MEDTIFTKINKGKIPSHKIYEDDKVFVILDINPLNKGHVLVISKEQVEFAWDLPEETYIHMTKIARKFALKIREATGTEKVGMFVYGLEVPHAHIHIVPLEPNEVVEFKHAEVKHDEDYFKEYAEKLAK